MSRKRPYLTVEDHQKAADILWHLVATVGTLEVDLLNRVPLSHECIVLTRKVAESLRELRFAMCQAGAADYPNDGAGIGTNGLSKIDYHTLDVRDRATALPAPPPLGPRSLARITRIGRKKGSP
jgi:hypothetical protein